MRAARIVVAAWGSFGDLHPHLALAIGLRDRGHRVIVASAPPFREAVERVGVEFHPIRPDLPDRVGNEALFARMMDRRSGTEFIVRSLVAPAVRQTYADIEEVAAGADLMVTGMLAFGAAFFAEQNGIPRVSTALQPSALFSLYDPPSGDLLPGVELLRRLPRRALRPLTGLVRLATDPWFVPLARFRAEIGLPPTPINPFLGGTVSPVLHLALFSPVFARPQPDWPTQTVATGFPFEPRVDGSTLPNALARFLDDGTPPIVFTLGSSAVYAPGAFWERSIEAVRALGHRGVLLVGPDRETMFPKAGADVIAVGWAAHSALFLRAAAVVHQGGIGTTAQALRAGVPMLVVPYAHDQPDNARRVAELGVALRLAADRYTARAAVDALARILDDPSFSARAASIAQAIRAEDGVGRGCEAIEAVLDGR